MKFYFGLLTLVVFSTLTMALLAAEEPLANQKLDNPFFAFDNGVGRGTLSPDQQAAMLKELGYDGIGYTGTVDLAERLKAFDQRGLKVFSLYIGAKIGPDGPLYDEHLQKSLPLLRGRDTILWLTIQGQATDAEEQAVQVTREIADMAATSNLRVALYPHFGFYVDRVEAAVQIVQKAGRKNVGATFNLCHFLRVGDAANLETRLKESMSYLSLVSINGADSEGDWDRLIQTLDRGEYDVYYFLQVLKSLGYDGPIGLQGYRLPGDPRENLTRSMAAWKKFVWQMEKGDGKK